MKSEALEADGNWSIVGFMSHFIKFSPTPLSAPPIHNETKAAIPFSLQNFSAMSSSSSSSSSYEKYEIRKRNPDPKTSVLLVIDMQNHFYSMAKPILTATKTTVDLCRNASVPIIFTRHCHKSPEDYGMLYEWWNGDLIMDGTPEAELIDELGRRDGDLVVEKNTYSAFRGTNLEEKLKKMGIQEVIVSGVMTNLCCETTAREAFVRGFRVFFSTDATATSSAELHEATLKNMAYGFAYLVDCKRIQEAFLKS